MDAAIDDVKIVELGSVVEETRHTGSGAPDNTHQLN